MRESLHISLITTQLLLCVLILPTSAIACDLCGKYTSVDSQKPTAGALRLGVAEQFTEFGTLLDNGHKIDNAKHQRFSSSISQFIASYDLTNEVGLQLSLPYINRRFTRFKEETVQRGTEAGFGDLTLITRYTPLQYRDGDALINLQFIGGIKLPTGDSDRLNEGAAKDPGHDGTIDEPEDNITHSRHNDVDHNATPSAVHGHDLALGSGSVDFPVGINLFAEKGRFFLKGGATYVVRTEGDHSYQYANDLLWDFGPAYYLYLDHDTQLAFRAVLSGESKGKDSGMNGTIQSDTALQSVFLGPELNLTTSDSLSGQLAYDIPLDINNSGVQSVATHRLRAGLIYNF